MRLQFPQVIPLLQALRDRPCDEPSCDYCRSQHNPERQLRQWFNFDAFRATPRDKDGNDLQRAIVSHAMADRPLFAILPTGGGKSLCFQGRLWPLTSTAAC